MTNRNTEQREDQRELALLLAFMIIPTALVAALFAFCILLADGTKMGRTIRSNEGMIDFIRISHEGTCRCPCQDQEQDP